MKAKHPLMKSVIIAMIFTGVVVIILPLVLLVATATPLTVKLKLPGAIGIVVSIIGATISLTCVKDFIIEGRGTPAPFDPPKMLVVKGFYKYVRNPMYLGLFLVILGEALLFQSSALLLYLAALIFFFNFFVIFYEEPKLACTFGDSYRHYCRKVRRWLPTLKIKAF